MDNSRVEIGKKLRKARLGRSMTQAQVADEAEINTNYYACIERGEVNPSLDKLERLVKALHIKSSDVLPY